MMNYRSRALAAAATLTLLVTTSACDNAVPRAPKNGIVTDIAFDARPCFDKTEKTVQLTYRPEGVDKNGAAWPLTPVCVTPEIAAKYTVGSKYP